MRPSLHDPRHRRLVDVQVRIAPSYAPLPQNEDEGATFVLPTYRGLSTGARPAATVREDGGGRVLVICALVLLAANVLVLVTSAIAFRAALPNLARRLEVTGTRALPRPDPLYGLMK
ncbi:hypothetical protein C8Q78DRAFT_1073189 [Trametes maxima]|nr:hypothetical protein C8Q78DRAFT_1073189 [Trametes maxima]